jgi:NTE family protein
MSAEQHTTGIVLGGGGARGAYEAGVIAGITDVLTDAHPDSPKSLFDVVCGTSVGAINAAWVAAHADAEDHDAEGLLRHWRTLELSKHLRLDPIGMIAGRPDPLNPDRKTTGRAVLNARALEELVEKGIPWRRLRSNIEASRIKGLVVTALHVATGTTTLFTDLAPGVEYPPSKARRRKAVRDAIRADHVLASAAIPLIFPARRIGHGYYADGGVRFNTPMAPALRLGVDRLVVIPLLSEPEDRPAMGAEDYPGPLFLAGKVMDALLLDPIGYDLQVLRRFNKLLQRLDEFLSPKERAAFDEVVADSRGAPYRRVKTLVFRPSQDLGRLALEHARRLRHRGIRGRLVSMMADMGGTFDADFLSFILFDAEYAHQLVELGRADVHARADEVREFFSDRR